MYSSVFTGLCEIHCNLILEHFLSSLKEALYPLAFTPHFAAPSDHWSTFCLDICLFLTLKIGSLVRDRGKKNLRHVTMICGPPKLKCYLTKFYSLVFNFVGFSWVSHQQHWWWVHRKCTICIEGQYYKLWWIL